MRGSFGWLLVLACVLAVRPAPAAAQAIIVDHTSLPLFDRIPDEYVTAAANMRMMFVNQSVGANINDGLTCLTYPSQDAAPTSCRRFTHVVPQFSSDPREVSWSRQGGYNRTNWDYYGWPGGGIPPGLPCTAGSGTWAEMLECFIQFVDANPARYDVYSLQYSYLQVIGGSSLARSDIGFFARRPNQVDIAAYEALAARHPTRRFVHHTTSLARAIGTVESNEFNNRLRQYVRETGGLLLDVADILSHDPNGSPCYDNRDGVPYSNGVQSENYPDDGLNLPAICQHYTPEINGGHLGNPDVAKIRIAKAYWVLMARLAGWNPEGGGTPPVPSRPTNLRIIRQN